MYFYYFFVFAGYDTSSGLDFESLGPSGAMITGSHSANNNTHINIPCTVTDSTTGATYSVSKIHNSSFIDSQNPITSVNIPSCIEEIGLYAFAYNAITSLSIPNGVEIIEALAFTNNDLASLTIGESVTHIGAQAFYSNNLVSIIIPQSTTFLGYDAFGDNLLTKVIFKGNNPSLGQESVFGGNQNLTVIKNYQNTTGWTDTCSSACFAWDQQLKFVVAPTAYSGPNQTIHDDATPGASVTLNGSNSSDDEGIITYSWSGSDGSSYSGISPIVNVSIGTTLFTLTVTDDDYESNTDPVRVSITLYNNPPVANAGSNQSVPEDATPGASVTLNASGSSDDNLITTYAWSGSDGSSYIGASHTITMPRGTIVYTLTVTDSHGDTDTDTVSITVYNPPPVANAGTNTTIHDDATPGTSVALDASGSSDNNPIASYAWAGSDGSTHTGISPTASVPVGTTVYTLTVTDADGETDTDTVTIILYNDAPTANAGTNQSIRDDSIPGGGSVTLDASGSSDDNPISSYTWTGSDGSSYSGISPAVTVALGTTVYTLTVTDSHGVTDTDTVSITLYNDAPIAEAGNNQTIQDDTTPGVSITLDGSGSTDDIEISSYSWSGSDGSTYSGISPTVSAPVGTTVYTLTVTDSHGETGTDTISINLQYYNYAPIAASGNNQTIHDDVIPGASVTLNANGSSDDIGIGSYSWSGSDGSTYSGISPMVSVAIGTTVFTLTVTDTDGVTDTDTVSITLYNNSPVAHAGTNQSIQDDATPGASVTLDASGSSDDNPVSSYLWSGSDGSSYNGISPTITAPVGTTVYTLLVTDSHGVTAIDTVSVTVAPAGDAGGSSDDNANQAPVAEAGNNQTIQDDDTPGTSLTLDGSGSTDDVGISSYSWTSSDGSTYSGISPSVSLPVGSTIFTLTVTDAGGKTDTDYVYITLNYYNNAPIAEAGNNQTINDDATPGASVTLNANGSSDDIAIGSYSWSGSDGSTYSGISPTVSVAIGTTVYTLTVTDTDGATGTDTVSITLYNNAPVANAGSNQSILDDATPGGAPVTLNASSSSDENPIASYAWSGSNGSSFSGISPSVTVALGTTVYTLTVTDSHGVTDTDTVSITLYNDAPIAEAGNNQTIQDDTTPGVSITLDGSGSTDDIEISSYSWSGSDGSTYSGISPTVSAPVGTTVYTLTVTDSHGETGTDTISINLQYYNYAPIAASGNNQTIHDDVIPGASVTLNANGSSDDIGIGSYSWSGSDGSTYSGISPMVSVAIGTTVFTLTVTDTDGVTDTDTVSITLYNNSPVAHAGTNQSIQDDATPGASVTLDASGSSDDNPVSSYLWSGSDGSSYNGISPTITAPVGTTVYTLLVTDSHGVTAIDTVSVTVAPAGDAGGSSDDNANQAPVAEAGNNQTIQDDDTPGTSLTLDGSGSTDDVGISSYSWTSSDGSTYSGISPSVSLPVGSTIFTLTVTDAGGKTDTDYVYITLNYYNNAPIAEAGNNQTINDDATPGASVTLNANGSSDDIAIGSYSWSGSDGSTYTGISPTVSVAIGTTVYTLIVTDTDGATDTDTVSITLYNNAPVANAGSNQSILDDSTPGDESVTLDASNSSDDNPIVSYAWSGSDGSNFSGVSSTVTMSIGTIVYTLTVTDSHGETDTDTVSITLYNNAPVANAGSNQSILDDSTPGDESVTLDASNSSDDNPIVSYAWSGSDGSNFSGVSSTVTMSIGTIVYTLTVTDSHGETDTDTVSIALYNNAPVANAGSNQSVTYDGTSASASVNLDGSGSSDENPITSYVWTGDDGSTYTGISPAITTPVGTTVYTLTVTDSHGVTDTDTMTISLATLPPTADAGPNQSFQVLYQGSLPVIELDASGSTDDMGISSYSWSGSNGEIFSGIKPLLSVPFGASTYVLTVKDAENQPDTDSVSITVVAYTEGNPPGESVSKTISTDGTATNSTITYGATSDGETLSTYFSINDEINLFSEIYTDPAYTGQPGEIYVVLVSKENGIIVYTALNEFGIWEVWNTSLKLLPSARYVEALGEVESIVIYSGALDAGEKLIYVGYSLYTPEGVPAIITTLQPYKLNVSD